MSDWLMAHLLTWEESMKNGGERLYKVGESFYEHRWEK